MKLLSTRAKLKQVQNELSDFREKAKALIYTLVHPKTRLLMSIVPTDTQGRINGITIPELIMLVNLNRGTNERIILEVEDKTLKVYAEALRPMISVSSL